MDEIAKRRANKLGDSREWTCLDALEDTINLIKSGEYNPSSLCIHFWEKHEDGTRTHHYQVAGLTFPEHIALLATAQHRVITEWHE